VRAREQVVALPAIITSIISHTVSHHISGRVLGYSVSLQFLGQAASPQTGGFIGGHLDVPAVFLGTATLGLGCALPGAADISAI
jgi:MFS family permease